MKSPLLVPVLAALVIAAGQSRVDFSGQWKLETGKSEHLPGSFAMLRSYEMNVRQSADTMTVVLSFSGDSQHVVLPATVYRFDGSEVYREDTLRGSKRWITSSWDAEGKKLSVSNRVNLKGRQGEVEYTQKDVWTLASPDTLTVTMSQHFAKRDSVHEERRVFSRER